MKTVLILKKKDPMSVLISASFVSSCLAPGNAHPGQPICTTSGPHDARRYARAVAKMDLVHADAMAQLSFLLRQAPTLASARGLMAPLCTAAARGTPPGAPQALREALHIYLAEYLWPKNAREKDVRVALEVLTSPVAEGGMIATFGVGGLALLVAQALTRGGHHQQGDNAVIDFFAHLLVHACKYNDDAGAAALTAEFGQWVSESRAVAAGSTDSQSSPDLLGRHELFSALLQKTFPHAEGTEIEGTSESLSPHELTA